MPRGLRASFRLDAMIRRASIHDETSDAEGERCRVEMLLKT
jgi:hypothetical protein